MSRCVDSLKLKLPLDVEISIPKQRKGTFVAKANESGVDVDCLGTSSHLPWGVFEVVEKLLEAQSSKSAVRGSAMNAKLGDANLPIDSVEGCIALFFQKKPGQRVLRRISPVANLLVWSGVCRHGKGVLILQ